jgi:hypothetical protein
MRTILKSVISPIMVMNNQEIKENKLASFIIVFTASVFGSIISPITYYLYNRSKFEIFLDIGSIIIMFFLSILTWLAACTLFWMISLLFKKEVGFRQITASWGFSYIPNLICIIAYSIVQMSFISLTGNSFIAVLINTLFIMLLVWKTLYFFIEMKFVMKLTGSELLIATIITAMVFLVLMGIDFTVGIQIPML